MMSKECEVMNCGTVGDLFHIVLAQIQTAIIMFCHQLQSQSGITHQLGQCLKVMEEVMFNEKIVFLLFLIFFPPKHASSVSRRGF